MTIWFLLALGSALSNSLIQAFFNYAVSLKRHSKFAIVFWYSTIASLILFLISFVIGFPEINSRFWWAVLITAGINVIANPILLKAYETGEFSSVYSMILLTPVFSLFISAYLLGESPTIQGIFGVLMTVLGLYIISKNKTSDGKISASDFKRSNLLGVFVAFLWAISTIYDKLATVHSNPVFAPAVALIIIAAGNGFYLLFREKAGILPDKNFKFSNYFLLFLLGGAFALSNVLHNSALLYGFVSYTIAIKRIGILFGVVWGWLFFREHGIRQKLFGSAVAVLGVILILFS